MGGRRRRWMVLELGVGVGSLSSSLSSWGGGPCR